MNITPTTTTSIRSRNHAINRQPSSSTASLLNVNWQMSSPWSLPMLHQRHRLHCYPLGRRLTRAARLSLCQWNGQTLLVVLPDVALMAPTALRVLFSRRL